VVVVDAAGSSGAGAADGSISQEVVEEVMAVDSTPATGEAGEATAPVITGAGAEESIQEEGRGEDKGEDAAAGTVALPSPPAAFLPTGHEVRRPGHMDSCLSFTTLTSLRPVTT
jgi:hypothetical protein